jgi:hypothetical protein
LSAPQIDYFNRYDREMRKAFWVRPCSPWAQRKQAIAQTHTMVAGTMIHGQTNPEQIPITVMLRLRLRF